jgi:hypothetical protein
MKPSSNSQWQRLAIYVLAALLLIRLLAMWAIPLTDTTEARYAEIARKMLETGNWVTLWHDYGIRSGPSRRCPPGLPPPAWACSASIRWQRACPPCCCPWLVLWLVADAARQRLGREAALATR